MEGYTKSKSQLLKELETDEVNGLSASSQAKSLKKYGVNEIKKQPQKTLFKRFIGALSEPTLVILEFAWIITVGVNLGKALGGGKSDVYECIGILITILISAFLTVFMEGRSAKAFEMLGRAYDSIEVKVIREGKTAIVNRNSLLVGDIVILEAGDKIVADGRLIVCQDLTTDESMLTGESKGVRKNAQAILKEGTPLAERENMVWSGTFVSGGRGKMVVTAVGESAELGKISKGIKGGTMSAPLNQKLTELGKIITAIGGVAAALVFVLSVVRLAIVGSINFFSVQDCFIEAIVLIVAAVPEGLPTTAAISLTLNVVRLANENALIRKLVAAETVGCVSVICSDKTGTLTQNKMQVDLFVQNGESVKANKLKNFDIIYNCAVNSTAELKRGKSGEEYFGSSTECALLSSLNKSGYNYSKLRDNVLIGRVLPFNSSLKYMLTEAVIKGEKVTFLKGAPEVVLKKCNLKKEKRDSILKEVKEYQDRAKRCLAFAHGNGWIQGEMTNSNLNFEFDGFAVISDPVRKEVKRSVRDCQGAGIEVKMLTGDNSATAAAIAQELGIITSKAQVVEASYIDCLSDQKLADAISQIKVIARSTPDTKLRVVEALKSRGEVVAVTGDGMNDAPAISSADVGISMGSGSEITKEASDVVLLDNCFSTIVKAISFGRNIYRNFQRFITFQLSVNLTAMITVVLSLLLGFKNPFNSLQLLWIDIIMDGPPALTLGLERGSPDLLKQKPVKRGEGIVTAIMLLRIILGGCFMSGVIVLEYLYDFMKVGFDNVPTVIFCLFVIFQLFNAFNCRKVGSESIFSGATTNKPMVAVFGVSFLVQILLTQYARGFFGTTALSFLSWVKIIAVAFSVVVFSEICKLFMRIIKKPTKNKRKFQGKLN